MIPKMTQVVTRLINTCALHQKTLENKLSLMVERMFSVTTASLIQKYHSTMALEGRLQALDPKPWMGKGWTQIRRKNGATVKSIHDIERNESIDMRLIDGTLSAIVTEKR